MSHTEEILKVLDGLLVSEDIYGCMVARKGIKGVIPPRERFNPKILDIWDMLQDTMDEFFDVISHYSRYGLGEVYFRLGDYEVLFYILPETDTALVAIIPSLANKGLLEVEMENAREKIIKIVGEK